MSPGLAGAAIVHLDLTADDLGAAEEQAVSLEPPCPSSRTRVGECYDPAGHPFCLTTFTPDTGD